MATEFLITGILLVFLLSELDYSSAFPRARSFVYSEAWPVIRKKQEGYGYGSRRPLQYIQALRQPHSKLQPKVHGQVHAKTWQKPQGRSAKDRNHAQIQTQPSMYHQTQSPYQPWSDVATKWIPEMSPSQHPPERNQPLPKPRGFEFSLKLPFADFLGQNKEAGSTTKGSDLSSGGSDVAGHYSQSYRPSSVQIYTGFNTASGSDTFSDKGSTNDPNGGKTAHDVSKPSFQLSLSVPIVPITPSSKPSSNNGGYLENLHRPGSGFVQNSNMDLVQSSSSQSGSEWIPSSTIQEQTERQAYEPIQTKYTDSTLINFSPGHASQHTTPTALISQGKIPTEQSLVFPEPSGPSLPIPQYPLQSDHVHSDYYSAQINPLSNNYEKGQSGQMVSPDPTNVHLPLSSSQYEKVPSGHYSVGQVKPNSNDCGQHQTWQPFGAPLTFASEQYDYDQFKPSSQNVETVLHLTPVHSSSPTVAQSQYELPSFHQVATTNDYGTGNVVQMELTDFSSSSPYHYSRDQNGQDALLDHLTASDPLPNFQGLSTNYQTQMRLPGQYTGRGQLDGKLQYTKLFIDVEDVTDGSDGQYSYFAAPPTHHGYSGTWTE